MWHTTHAYAWGARGDVIPQSHLTVNLSQTPFWASTAHCLATVLSHAPHRPLDPSKYIRRRSDYSVRFSSDAGRWFSWWVHENRHVFIRLMFSSESLELRDLKQTAESQNTCRIMFERENGDEYEYIYIINSLIYETAEGCYSLVRLWSHTEKAQDSLLRVLLYSTVIISRRVLQNEF